MANRWIIEYASGESSATAGKTFRADPDGTTTTAAWMQCIGPGTVVVVCEGGQTTTLHVVGGEVYKGSFTSLTSTTCQYLRMGNGPPPPAVPVGTSPSTTTSVGAVQLSVAPLVAATPVAVGTNDPRVTTRSMALFVTQADGTLAESSVWIPGVVGTITAVSLSFPGNVTQSDTDYLTLTLGIRDGAGGSASTVASKTTKTTGGGAFLAFQALSLGTITNPTTTATSQLTFKSVKSGAGQAVTGLVLLNITYTVP